MNRVLKYPLQSLPVEMLTVPKGSQILSVQEQRGKVVIYALEPDSLPFDEAPEGMQPIETYVITIAGTGLRVENPGTFLGTLMLLGGNLVWHVFYRKAAGV